MIKIKPNQSSKSASAVLHNYTTYSKTIAVPNLQDDTVIHKYLKLLSGLNISACNCDAMTLFTKLKKINSINYRPVGAEIYFAF